MSSAIRRRLPWLVPLATIAVTITAAGLSRALPAGADPIPVLPPLTPAQLVDKVRSAQVTTLSGDITMTSNLGLPDLGSLGVGGGTLLDLLSGSHHAHIAVDGPDHVRVALDAPQAENDWIRNGADLWAWDSSTQHVQHALLPALPADATATAGESDATPGVPEVDPQAAADELLKSIDPTTDVTVRTPGYVAGRPVYELVVAPKSTSSTVADGTISVDAATGLPLAVRIDARATNSAAFTVAFTSLSLDKPSPSTFAFTPPPGATVEQVSDPTKLLPLGGQGEGGHHERARRVAGAADPSAATSDAPAGSHPNVTTIGTAWESVAIVSGVDLAGQLQSLFANSPAITVGSHSAHLISTSLVNVLVLDDGRVAVAALTPDALVAAVAAAK